MKRLVFIGLVAAVAIWACSDEESVTPVSEADVTAAAAPGSASLNVDLDQWANGTDSKTPEWQNGNLNGNNSAYAELRVVPFRLAVEGLTPGTHRIHINHDFTAGGRKAYDFLASVDATEMLAQTGFGSVEDWLCSNGGGAVSSLCTSEGGSGLGSYDAEVFPYDPFNGTPYLTSARQVGGGPGGLSAPGTMDGTPTAVQLAGLTDEERQLRIYGGEIISISMPTHDGPLDRNSQADMVVEFSTAGSAVLLTWGGHLSCSVCWESQLGGEPNGASQISGAPWHMRTQNLDGGGSSNQDRSIQPSAIVPPGRIDGYKYLDLNANGARDAGEPGLENWQIELTFGTETLTTTTDGTGYFAFETLPPGLYDLAEVCPLNGWMQSEPAPTDGCGSGVYTGLTVGADATTSVNFGNYEFGSQPGYKYHDLNANGVWDTGEPPLEGWTIQALQGTTLVAETLTDVDGAYSLDLAPGDYTIQEVCPVNGWIQSEPAPTDGCGSGTYSVTIVSGQVEADRNFGNYERSSETGYKYHDLNANGAWDTGEPPLEGWTIQAWQGTTLVAETLTGVDGGYSFMLAPGSYSLREVCPTGWVQSEPVPADGCGSGTYEVTVVSGVLDPVHNFGNYQLGSQPGYKYHDLNANGVWDTGEPPLEGWTIQAWQGTTLVAETLTDVDGAYSLDLAPGDYTIQEVCPVNGWIQSEPAPTDGCGSGTYSVTIVSGQVEADRNFGNYERSSETGYKYLDLNANGAWDTGEPPLEGWTIQAWQGTTLVAETLTGVDGGYSFMLAPGSYSLREVCATGWVQSEPVPADGCGSGTYEVTVVSGVLDPVHNFGNYQLASVSGVKFWDAGKDGDEDGLPDTDDSPLEGFTIQLYADADASGTLTTGDAMVGSTVTASDGSYTFSGLEPGSYLVCEATNSPWLLSYPLNVICGDGLGGLEPGGWTFTLPSGQNETGNNFFNTGEIFGCTPGYWKNHTDRWVGFSWSDPLDAAFAETLLGSYADATMLEALGFPGGNGIPGAQRILLRAAVASALNFAHPDVAFEVPEAGSLPALFGLTGLVDAVNGALANNDRATILALATQLDDANNAVNSCPLSGTRAFRPS
jgi:protocatechuate 3,4-dioxygenase beta subunit